MSTRRVQWQTPDAPGSERRVLPRREIAASGDLRRVQRHHLLLMSTDSGTITMASGRPPRRNGKGGARLTMDA